MSWIADEILCKTVNSFEEILLALWNALEAGTPDHAIFSPVLAHAIFSHWQTMCSQLQWWLTQFSDSHCDFTGLLNCFTSLCCWHEPWLGWPTLVKIGSEKWWWHKLVRCLSNALQCSLCHFFVGRLKRAFRPHNPCWLCDLTISRCLLTAVFQWLCYCHRFVHF